MSEHRFYQFQDNRGNYYYHDPINNTSQWQFPEGSIVINSVTGETVTEAPEFKPNKSTEITTKSSTHDNSISSISFKSTRFRTIRSRKNTNLSSSLTGPLSTKELEDQVYFPETLVPDRSRSFDYNSLANILNMKRAGLKAFQKPTAADYERFLQFEKTMTPQSVPLLKATEQDNSKQAQDLFKFIIDFCNPTSTLHPSEVLPRVGGLSIMIEEFFAQLIKFIRNNPDIEARSRAWQLLCVACSLYQIDPNGPANPIRELVKILSATSTRDTNRLISNKALISYIRFYGDHPCTYPPDEIDAWIQVNDSLGIKPFGSSVYELLWIQRQTLPNCPIPIIIHKICKGVIDKGGEKMVRIFTQQGQQKDIENLIERINQGDERAIPEASLLDLSTLVKRWLENLQSPLIPQSILNDLLETQDYIGFANKLPKANKDLLMYLVGFWKQICKCYQVTNMNESAVAHNFGNTVLRNPMKDKMSIMKTFKAGKAFLIKLLEEWDCSAMYPLPESALQL